MTGNNSLDQKGVTINLPGSTLLWMSLLMIVLGTGGAIYAQIIGHHHAFANTRQMPWGMLIGVYTYFAITSTGLCILATFSHIFDGNRMEPLANRMVWLSIIMLFSAFSVIGLEMENTWRMPLGMLLHPNITSNIWWMGTLYGIAVTIMLAEFFLIVTRRFRAAVFLGVLAAMAEALASSNLGSVFASLASRPFWYGSQLPLFFIGCAVLSGAAAIVLFTHFSHLLQRRRMTPQTFNAVQTAGKIMLLMIFLLALATAWKMFNAYCGPEAMALAADSLVSGPLSTSFWLFEVALGLVLPFLLLAASRLRSLQILSCAALMVLIGQFFSRFNLVVAGQIVPADYQFTGVPTFLSYSPSSIEYLLVAAGAGVLGLGFILGERFLDTIFNTPSHQH